MKSVGIAGERGVDHDHLALGVVATRDRAHLRPVLVHREAEREPLAGLDLLRRRLHDVVGDQVEGADLVVVAPAAPVADLGRRAP